MNLSYLVVSALLFLLSKAKKVVKKAAKGLPPAADNDDERDQADSILDDGRDDPPFERDRADSILDDGREGPSFYRYDDEAILDSVWEDQGVESDEFARAAADLAYKRAIDEGFHPLLGDAVALAAYDKAGGQSPWYIEKKQAAIGADATGEFDEQTEDKIDLIVAVAKLASQGESKPLPQLPPASTPVPSTSPKKIDAQMFELKEPADWDLTPDQRRTHAEARKLAIKEYQKARANGQSHSVGAAMWLGRYMKSGGTRTETIYMMQRESDMPYDQQNGVWDQNTKDWVTRTTADYRASLSKKKR